MQPLSADALADTGALIPLGKGVVIRFYVYMVYIFIYIFLVNNQNDSIMRAPVSAITGKCVMLPYHDDRLFFTPITHICFIGNRCLSFDIINVFVHI